MKRSIAQVNLLHDAWNEFNIIAGRVGNMKEFVNTAWDCSPSIAIRLGERFPNSATAKKSIEKKVREYTHEVLNVPEAFPYLVTAENVKANIPQLKVDACNKTLPF
jgi:hypothetical protein